MQSNEDYSSNIVTADDHRNISTPDETTPLTQSSPHIYCRYFSPRCFGLIGYSLSLAPSGSGYVYFKRNLLLAHGTSKRLDLWWASVKRKLFGRLYWRRRLIPT